MGLAAVEELSSGKAHHVLQDIIANGNDLLSREIAASLLKRLIFEELVIVQDLNINMIIVGITQLVSSATDETIGFIHVGIRLATTIASQGSKILEVVDAGWCQVLVDLLHTWEDPRTENALWGHASTFIKKREGREGLLRAGIAQVLVGRCSSDFVHCMHFRTVYGG